MYFLNNISSNPPLLKLHAQSSKESEYRMINDNLPRHGYADFNWRSLEIVLTVPLIKQILNFLKFTVLLFSQLD